VNEKHRAKPTPGDLHHKTKKQLYTEYRPLKHAFRANAFRRLKKMLHVSTLSFRTGIAGDRLLGPYFLPPRPSEAVCHDFPRKVLPELLQYVHLQNLIHLWIMHDAAPPYFLVALREFLNNLFPERIGQSELTVWPGPSPDFSPLYFYLW
jgi:hypothetical protein